MRKLFWLLLVLTSFLVIGCGGKEAAKDETTKKELVIGIMPDLDSVPLVMAREKNYFAAEKVNVKLMVFKSAVERDAALQGGSIDGTISDVLAAAFLKNGGFDNKITSLTDGSYALIASKGKAEGLDDLEGKDVAVSKNTIIEYITDSILKREKKSPDFIEKVVIPQIPVRLEMLKNGKLTAATLPEPMASIAVAGGAEKIASSNDMGINPGILLFSGKAMKEKSQEIKAFYRAYNKAVAYLNETKREDYIDLVVEKCGFPALAKETLKLPAYHKATLPSKEDFESSLDWLGEKNLIKSRYKYEDLTTKDFLP